MLERLFQLERRGSTVATELRAGLVTFLTMAYILLVNPQILAQAGMPAADVAVATALSAAIASAVMGLYANFPFALAPGMGLNAYFTFGVVAALGVSWQIALAAVFVEGLLFLALSLSGARTALLEAIPGAVKLAATGGIGLFLALIGFESAGVVRADPATLVGLGDVASPAVLLALGGIVLVAVLLVLRVKGAVLVGIAAVTAAAWLGGLAEPPHRFFQLPAWPRETFLAFDLRGLLAGKMLAVVFAFLFVDLLDTAGTLVGVGQLAGFCDRRGNLPGAGRAFAADAVGTAVGAALGTSTVTSYIESATGVEEGGRTGLTALTTGALFIAALVFTPLLTAVPGFATAPALVVVGALMMRPLLDLDWGKSEEAIPAFLTLTVIPFTYSIANGLAAGILAWVAIRVATGRVRQVGWVMGALAVALVAFYAFAHAG